MLSRIREWLNENGLSIDQYKFTTLIPRIEKQALKFISLTKNELSRDIWRYRGSFVLQASRSVDIKNMTYIAYHLGKKVEYNHKTRILKVTIDDDPFDMEGTISVSRYRLNDNMEFEPYNY